MAGAALLIAESGPAGRWLRVGERARRDYATAPFQEHAAHRHPRTLAGLGRSASGLRLPRRGGQPWQRARAFAMPCEIGGGWVMAGRWLRVGERARRASATSPLPGRAAHRHPRTLAGLVAAPIARCIHGVWAFASPMPGRPARRCPGLSRLSRRARPSARKGCGPASPSGRPPFRCGAFRAGRARAVYHSVSAFARRFDYIAGRFGTIKRKTAHLYRRAGFLHFTFLQFAHIINHEGHESLRTCRGARRRG